MARLPRPHMSLSVKLAACLDALGFPLDAEIEWDHTWALGLRPRTADGGYDPPANDPRYIRPKMKGEHATKTRGNGATTAGSDVHLIAKGKRLAKNQEAFREMLMSKAGRALAFAARAHGKRRWPSKKLPSRPFNTWRPPT